MARAKKKVPTGPKAKAKIKKTMGEFSAGTLHHGLKTGPVVKDRKVAVAIALNQARRESKGRRSRSRR